MNALEQHLFDLPESMHAETERPFRAGYKAGFEAAVTYFYEQLRDTLGADEVEAELRKLRKLGLEAYDPTGGSELSRYSTAEAVVPRADRAPSA